MGSVYHEAQRVENQTNPSLHGLTPNQQTNLAQLRGDRAAKVWNRLTPAATTPNHAATQAWNQQHQTALSPGTAQVASSNDGAVRPRVLEHLDPRYHRAVEHGDLAEAQRLKEGWENIETWIPMLGSGVDAVEAAEEGNYGQAVLYSGLAVTEAVGVGALRKAGAQGVKMLWKSAMKMGVGKRGVVKSAGPITKFSTNPGHLAKRATLLGYDITPQAAQKIVPALQKSVTQLLNNANPALTKIGRWHGYEKTKMYISNGKMIVTKMDGTFITIIGKTSNNWYLKATSILR